MYIYIHIYIHVIYTCWQTYIPIHIDIPAALGPKLGKAIRDRTVPELAQSSCGTQGIRKGPGKNHDFIGFPSSPLCHPH